jgi:multidrug efflux pump subunit AcrA (membrane-fusion protein)
MADLAVLSGSNGADVARPRRRVLTRVIVPAAIVLSAAGLLLYAMRGSLTQAIEVQVAPAVLVAGGPSGGAAAPAGEVVQAPGWIEADPNDIGVPALATGVVKELLVLDGQKVVAGEVVAKLVDEDAKLAVQKAEAEVARADSALEQVRGEASADEARAAQVHDDFNRKQAAGKNAVSEGDLAQMRLKVSEHDAVCYAAKAAVKKAEAESRQAKVALDEAKLTLDRMQVRAPVGGVVLARMVIPGQRLMLDANDPFAGVVAKLYDPEHLQVRVDIPLADAAKVKVGDAAEITTETLGGRKFSGKVTRFVHEANVQKNTVQVKVSISDPAPELKPEMLAKARIMTGGPATPSGGMGDMPGMPGMDHGAGHSATPPQPSPQGGGGVLMVPRSAIVHMSGMPEMVWVVDQRASSAEMRHLRLGGSSGDSVEVLEGLRPGDRVIVSPPESIRDGTKVRVKEGV